MQDSLFLLGILVALLVGLAAGKAWERYKLVEGRWVDRRRSRQSPHFILGLNYLVAGQVDLSIAELEKAASVDPGALELRLVLGNLYREKGQVGRAIQEHQALPGNRNLALQVDDALVGRGRMLRQRMPLVGQRARVGAFHRQLPFEFGDPAAHR